MSARHAWREAYRAARKDSGTAAWVRGCFPRGWMVDTAARRLGRLIGLGPVPYRVAIALDVAANHRRKGSREAARMFTGFARRANVLRDLVPSPAIGA